MHKCHKMRQKRVKYVHFSGDHGHRQGQESLVKGWSFAAWDKDGNRFIDLLCSDINQCGHTTKSVVAGIKKSFYRIKMLVPGLMCISSEGDAGGGGSVQSTFDPLMIIDVLGYINDVLTRERYIY